MSKYRLYIDESGTHGYTSSNKIKERYLCLLGVIVSAEHNEEFIVPEWEELREIFTEDPDFPALFHFTDVVSGSGLFKKLEDDTFKGKFNQKFLSIVSEGEYKVCGVVLDKKTHKEAYGSTAMRPYHYCINVLLERYVRFLQAKSSTGDVVVEGRGGKEDKLLRSEFERFYQDAPFYLEGLAVRNRLASKKLKLKTKEAGIVGLELADMLAVPMKFFILNEYGRIDDLKDNFTKTVIDITKCKIHKNPFTGQIKGFGIKLI